MLDSGNVETIVLVKDSQHHLAAKVPVSSFQNILTILRDIAQVIFEENLNFNSLKNQFEK